MSVRVLGMPSQSSCPYHRIAPGSLRGYRRARDRLRRRARRADRDCEVVCQVAHPGLQYGSWAGWRRSASAIVRYATLTQNLHTSIAQCYPLRACIQHLARRHAAADPGRPSAIIRMSWRGVSAVKISLFSSHTMSATSCSRRSSGR